jgi:hypothetical protein
MKFLFDQNLSPRLSRLLSDQSDAANRAMTPLFHVLDHWRPVADLERSLRCVQRLADRLTHQLTGKPV